jgi:hypothetical protein
MLSRRSESPALFVGCKRGGVLLAVLTYIGSRDNESDSHFIYVTERQFDIAAMFQLLS